MKDHIIIIFAFCLVSCSGNYFRSGTCAYNYTISIGDNISIDKSELETAVSSAIKQSRGGRHSIEIVIFGYSSGKEIFSYSENNPDKIIIGTRSGRIEALVKIREGSLLKKALFLKASGNTKEEILHSMAIELRKALCD